MNDITCVCDYGIDSPAVYDAQRPIARKQHTCSECGCPIEAGERYERVKTLYDRWDTYRTCYRCLALRDHLEAVSCCFCWYHDNMLEDAANEIDFANWKPGYKFAALRLYADVKRNRRAYYRIAHRRGT